MGNTLLTAKPTEAQLKERESERKDKEASLRHFSIAEILCKTILRSREDSRISIKRATAEIVKIGSTTEKKGRISTKCSELLVGKYVKALYECDSPEGSHNGHLSGLRELVKESKTHLEALGYLTASNRDGRCTLFEVQAELFAEYGLIISPDTVQKWSQNSERY